MTAINIRIFDEAAYVMTDTYFRTESMNSNRHDVSKIFLLPCIPGFLTGRGDYNAIMTLGMMVQICTHDFDIALKKIKGFASKYRKLSHCKDFELFFVGFSAKMNKFYGVYISSLQSNKNHLNIEAIPNCIVTPAPPFFRGGPQEKFQEARSHDEIEKFGFELLQAQKSTLTESGYIVKGRGMYCVVNKNRKIEIRDVGPI